MAIPAINVLGNQNVTEGNFQIAIEDLRKSVIGSGKAYDSANTYSQYDTCVSGGIVYYSKIDSNTGNTPAVNANWGLIGDLITGVVHNVGNESIDGIKTFSSSPIVPNATTATQAIAYGQAVKNTGNETIDGNKNFNNKVLISSSDGILGYASGTGAQVTQGSSSGKSTPIVLDKPSGFIIMNNAALASQSSVYFTISNNKFLASDGVVITQSDGGFYSGVNYDIRVVYKADGLLGITVKNISASTLSDAVRFRFDLIRGANS